MPWPTIAFLRDRLGKGSLVFEYGSGGSTLFLARLGARVVSVEHDKKWSDIVRQRLESEGFDQVDYRSIPPEKSDVPGYNSPVRGFEGMSFQKYVHTIDAFPDGHFDIVIVDGRARNDCVRVALPKVRKGGYLLLDNSERDRYLPAVDHMSPYPRRVFRGLNPYQLDPGESTVWKIKERPS